MNAPHDDESLVDLRCSVVVVSDDAFLLIARREQGDWVLPGGRPRPGESMQSCARRETLEETGLRVEPSQVAFVAEVIEPADGHRIVELVFHAVTSRGAAQNLGSGEPNGKPTWITAAALGGLNLRPPIGGFLPALLRRNHGSAAYLGNLWRPERGDRR